MRKVALITSLDNSELSDEAIKILSKKFEIVKVFRFNRFSPKIDNVKKEFGPSLDIDYLINFLSPKYIPNWLIELPRISSINIHPGSFEYPGVGSASLSIFDSKSTYGVCAHYIDERFDSGGIILERTFVQPREITCDDLFNLALKECLLLLNDLVELLAVEEKPKIIKTWARKAVTRKEFNEWMTISINDQIFEIEKKIAALKHPRFDGPFIKIGNHRFKYDQNDVNQ